MVTAALDVGERLDARRWRALAVCLTAVVMTLVDATIVNVALPSIGASTGASTSQLQWVVSGYVLAFGMVPIVGGRLGDDRGRRAMLLVGIAGFVVTSTVVGLAPNPTVLVVGRVVQGVAGGLVNPQVSGLVQQLFPLRERGRAFGALGATVGVATALGPVLGGAILALGGPRLGWRLTFLLNVPIGVTSYVLCRRWLPVAARRGPHRSLDLPGVGMLALGLFGLLFPAVEYDAAHDARLALLVVPALAVLAGFVGWEAGPARRRGHPLIDVALLRVRSYSAGLGLALLYFCGYTGLPLVLALFLQEGLGFSPFASGLTAAAYAAGTAISAPIGGRLLNRLGRRLLVGALGLFLLGTAAATAVTLLTAGSATGYRAGLLLAGPLLLAGLGGGSVITPNQALSLAEVDVRGGSTAGGTLQTAQRIGAAIGTAVLSAVFYAQVHGDRHLAGAARARHYADAFAASLVLTLGFAAAALTLAIVDARATAVRRAR